MRIEDPATTSVQERTVPTSQDKIISSSSGLEKSSAPPIPERAAPERAVPSSSPEKVDLRIVDKMPSQQQQPINTTTTEEANNRRNSEVQMQLSGKCGDVLPLFWVLDPNTLNLDPAPDPGSCYQI